MKMALKTVKKEPSLADKAYTQIKASIIANELKPDEILAEETLAEQLGISRTPIRSALHRLLYEEFVVQKGKNIVVAAVTERDVRDVNIVRLQLEPASPRLIEQNGGITSRQLEKLRKYADKQLSAAQAGKRSGFLENDYQFHVMLAQLTENTYLYDMISRCNLIIRRFHELSGTLMTHSVVAAEEHYNILRAFEQGDYEAAEQEIRLHIQNVDARFFQ